MLTPRQYGLSLSPPVSKQRITLLCRQGRIPAAFKVGLAWAIPENAQITPVSRGRPRTEKQMENWRKTNDAAFELVTRAARRGKDNAA